uniref:Uncharacterized protein n=1 Tax=Arundo donax TaxID=35708 RepID=A0A0A9BUC8_ARUDO
MEPEKLSSPTSKSILRTGSWKALD